jgi:FAD/FMN-containing dehydrogenase
MDIVRELRSRLAADAVIAGAEIEERHLRDFLVAAPPGVRPVAVVYPRSTADVAATLAICNAHRVPVVPQGGLTGLAGGATPMAGWVVLSLQRMRAIEEIDRQAATMTVEAGVPLQLVQEAADAADLLFPMDIGARGSCLIGGNVSTNAGGNRVLRYGMTRELVLGLEAVLADGTIVTSLNKMLKNNAGYDIKQLFIGSEGTLGVVTRLVLRLFPKPRSLATALCGLPDYDRALMMLQRARAHLSGALTAFEVMWPRYYFHATEGLSRRAPLPQGHGVYLLIEAMGGDRVEDEPRFARLIEGALEDGIVSDAIIAQSLKDARDLWSVRDAAGEIGRSFGPGATFDVSIPTGELGKFAEVLTERLTARWADADAVFFGHVADANVHISVRTGAKPLPLHDIEEIVYGTVRDWGGSVSAEHGIGLLKKPYLGYSRSPAEIEVMKRLKAALDPRGILNPGKVF